MASSLLYSAVRTPKPVINGTLHTIVAVAVAVRTIQGQIGRVPKFTRAGETVVGVTVWTVAPTTVLHTITLNMTPRHTWNLYITHLLHSDLFRFLG